MKQIAPLPVPQRWSRTAIPSMLIASVLPIALAGPAAAQSAPPARTAPELGIRRHLPPPPPAALAEAHAAYRDGALDDARRLFLRARDADPASVAASNGLASLALREGRREEAIAGFRRSLALAPDDALAHARLADLDPAGAPHDTEARLRAQLRRQTDAAVLHFALGNALARQQRWAEARLAYLRAHALDAHDPDTLHNLAVSLDRLNQREAARIHYRQALEAANWLPAAFDARAASDRLAALESP